jgi:hypothetical protein
MLNRYFAFLVFSLLLFSVACKSKKNVVRMPVDAAVVTKYWENQFTGEYLEASGKASVTLNGKTNNVALHLRLKMDSIVWAKFSMFGIGATVLITKDSFFMINTLAQEYMTYSISYLDHYLGFKASLQQVQNMLLGNALFDKSDYTFKLGIDQLNGNEGLATNILTIDDQNRTFTSKINTADTTQKADIQYLEYASLDSHLLPTKVNIHIKTGEQLMDVVLNYQNLSSSYIATFPFKIPNGYIKK